MKDMSKLKWIYGGIALMLVITLGACNSVVKTGTEASEKGKLTEDLEENPVTGDSIEENTDISSKEDSTEEKMVSPLDLPKYLPADFPLPDDAEILLSNSEENDGKKYVFLTVRSKQNMDAITSLYTTYFEKRKLEDDAQTIDDKNIIIQGESPTYSEYWSLIGGLLTDSDGVIELVITWEEL